MMATIKELLLQYCQQNPERYKDVTDCLNQGTEVGVCVDKFGDEELRNYYKLISDPDKRKGEVFAVIMSTRLSDIPPANPLSIELAKTAEWLMNNNTVSVDGVEISSYRGLAIGEKENEYTHLANAIIDGCDKKPIITKEDVDFFKVDFFKCTAGWLIDGSKTSLQNIGCWKCNIFVGDALYLMLLRQYKDANKVNKLLKDKVKVKDKYKKFRFISSGNRYQTLGKAGGNIPCIFTNNDISFINPILKENATKGCFCVFFGYDEDNEICPGHIEIISEYYKEKNKFRSMGAHKETTNVKEYNITKSEPTDWWKKKEIKLYEINDDNYDYVAFFKINEEKLNGLWNIIK